MTNAPARNLPPTGSTRREIAEHWIRHFQAQLDAANPLGGKRAYHPAKLALEHWTRVRAALGARDD